MKLSLAVANDADPLPRRAKGTGTIRKSRDGRFRALYAFTAGKREEIDGSPFESYEAADRALAAVLLELRALGATNHGLPLRKVAERCFDSRELGGYRSVKSERDRWEAYVEKHDLAGTPIGLVAKGEVRALLNGLRKTRGKGPLATQTKRNVLNMLRAVFDYAVEAELVDDNPLLGMKVKDSGRVTETRRPLSLEQCTALLATAKDPIVAVAVGTGMRSGELRALRWEHVHLDGSSPHVMCCYGGTPAKPRKNGKVHRVSLFGLALDTFRAMAKRLHADDREGIVFRSFRGSYRAIGHAVERDEWLAWLGEAKIDRRVRFHDLRHTCATLLLNGAWGRKWTYEEVKELLDHSSVKVTERYAKALGSLVEDAAAEMRSLARSKKGTRRGKDRGAMGAHIDDAVVAQAIEILQRRGSDSNRRLTVLQSHVDPNVFERLASLALHARSYVSSVAERSPLVHVRALDLADAVFELVDAAAEPMTRLSTGSRP